MRYPRGHYQKIQLARYLKDLDFSAAEGRRKEIGEEILTLIFSYARSKAGLNIRLHRHESETLLYLTAEELFNQKGKDPDLNGAYDLLEKIDPADTRSRETILNLAERVLKNRAQILGRISKGPRNRKEHPFKQIVRETTEDYGTLNHIQIRKKAITEGYRLSMIEENDEDNEQLIFLPHMRASKISYPTIRDWISSLKKKKVSRD